MKTVDDLNEIAGEIESMFPCAIRGSVSKSRYGSGRKTLHLSYWIASDTVGGLIVQAKGDLLYFIEWDTNSGWEWKFAESENSKMVARLFEMFYGQVHKISRTVCI